MSNMYFGDDDLITNTSSRIPVCLCLDVSGSMYDCIGELEDGVNAFYDAVRKHDAAKDSCEIAVVTFGSTVQVLEDYSTVDRKSPLKLTANGGTPMAEGAEKALEILEARKNEYKANGVDYYQPWLVIITDGKPGDMEDIPAAQDRTRKLVEAKRLTLFPIAVGSDENPDKFRAVMDVLNGFGSKRAKHLKDLKFNEFFEWLGKSMSAVSASQVGDKVKLDTTGMDDWSEI